MNFQGPMFVEVGGTQNIQHFCNNFVYSQVISTDYERMDDFAITFNRTTLVTYLKLSQKYSFKLDFLIKSNYLQFYQTMD